MPYSPLDSAYTSPSASHEVDLSISPELTSSRPFIHIMVTQSKQRSAGASFQAFLSSANASVLTPTSKPSSFHQAMQYALWEAVV